MESIRSSVRRLSVQMKERTEDLRRVDRRTLLAFLDTIGTRSRLQPADESLLSAVRDEGGLLCVDASYRRFGGASPHYLELYQGIGIASAEADRAVRKTAAHSPLTGPVQETDFSFGEPRSQEAETRLAAIELETAAELVKEGRGYALVMDGSLIRFQILCPDAWEDLRARCREKNLPVVGVIEDIKTDNLGKAVQQSGLTRLTHYDREILAGRLEMGEVLIPDREVSGKADRGLLTLFARFAREPGVIGIDLDGDDANTLIDLARILYAITPAHGRGIPYLLDIVDRKARLEDARSEEIIKRSLDPDVLEAYFLSARNRRRI